MTIAVLGAGMVGRAIALDLAKDYDVTSLDLNAKTEKEALATGLTLDEIRSRSFYKILQGRRGKK